MRKKKCYYQLGWLQEDYGVMPDFAGSTQPKLLGNFQSLINGGKNRIEMCNNSWAELKNRTLIFIEYP